MPGILPMKLIKCGSSQARIAQACDRCRSKKIRCDGIRPCCSQCSNVGFECKTSDKLSRRAFPRGYTESLEEKVRSLEQEVREMKDLLDLKDEQLETLSRIHSFSPYSPPASAVSGGSHRVYRSTDSTRSRSAELAPEDTFVVHEAPSLVGSKGSGDNDVFYVGLSSGRPLLELFKEKIGAEFNIDVFFEIRHSAKPVELNTSHVTTIRAPPRLLSDQLLVSYFQEYHPLFPVLHRPTFLASYENLISEDASQARTLSQHDRAQLFLAFAIALQHSESRNDLAKDFDNQWQQSLNAIVMESTMETLQCLVLAQLRCFSSGDYAGLIHYKSLAVGVALKLGLNQRQRKFSLGALRSEMRKRVFWCVYCLDSFSAAMLGLPRLFKDEGIDTEYPSDVDDEYVSKEGFLPAPPGDSTKISSALALFRLTRVLSKVLDTVYLAASSHELSYNKLKELEDGLDTWKSGLAPHLRLEFVNGAPATNVVHSRSPLLVLAYHYTRVLIHRPVVGSTLDERASASLHLVRESSKCMIQLVQLLTERKLGFSFCLNKDQLLLMSAFALLCSTEYCPWHVILAKENHGLILGVLEELDNCSPPTARELRSIVNSVANAERRITTNKGQHGRPKECSMPTLTLPIVSVTKEGLPRSSLPSKSVEFGPHKGKNGGGIRRASSQDMPSFGSHHSVRLTSASLTDLLPASRARYPAAGHAAMTKLPHNNQSLNLRSPYPETLWGTGMLPNDPGTEPQTPRPSISYEWERMLAVMDPSHAAHVHGGNDGGSGTLIHSSGSPSAETGLRPVDRHRSLNETPAAASFHGAPPLISSFSMLPEKTFAADDLRGAAGELDVGSSYPESDNLADFFGPLMDAQGGGTLLGNEWHM